MARISDDDSTRQLTPAEVESSIRLIAAALFDEARLRTHCAQCSLPIGVELDHCTGWHPAFRCGCGFEEHSERATAYRHCPHCGEACDVLDAEFLTE